ncbi:MAG: alpha/beta hydrolase, partial [Chloroflexota bacterium]|nr:alpha/beta hydrolase [Chloroflexota bacterium]
MVHANGAELYCETRGSGPTVLFISGATGDAGHFSQVADLLADAFTVVTYDRRANSRSPRPVGWTRTSTDEQADDAAALLEALNLAPAAVYGNSGGAIIATCLLLRHSDVVRKAILHEPPMISVLADPEAVLGMIRSRVDEGMARGGPRGAVEAFVRFAAGDANFERLDPALRERMLGNGQTLFDIEFGVFESYRAPEAELAAVSVPVQVLAGAESAPFFHEAAGWLADRLNVPLAHSPGAHTPQFDHPHELADALRPILG